MTVLHARLDTSETYLRLVPEVETAVSAMMRALPLARSSVVDAEGVAVTTYRTAHTVVETMVRPWSGDAGPASVTIVRISCDDPGIVPVRIQCEAGQPDPERLRETILTLGETMRSILASLRLDDARRAEMETERVVVTAAVAHRIAERLGRPDVRRIAVGLPGPFSPLRARAGDGADAVELLERDQGSWGLPPSVDMDLGDDRVYTREIVIHVAPRAFQEASDVSDPVALLRMATTIPRDGPSFRPDVPGTPR